MFSKLTKNAQDAIIANYADRLSVEFRRLRLESGISRNELSARSGVSRPSIAGIEERTSQPSTGNLMKLTYALGTTCSSLFEFIESDFDKSLKGAKDGSISENAPDLIDEEFERALLKLRRKSVTNPDLRSTVIELAKLQTTYSKANPDKA